MNFHLIFVLILFFLLFSVLSMFTDINRCDFVVNSAKQEYTGIRKVGQFLRRSDGAAMANKHVRGLKYADCSERS